MSMTIPAGVRVRVSETVPIGQVLIMADFEHPEARMFDFTWGPNGLESKANEVPDGRIIYCRPENEQAVLALAQERPKWWLDWQRIERLIREALRP